jgi:NADPH:quinone reductase-like Zn-dependent oxidoreductase
MRAAVIHENGDLDQVKVEDIPEPELGDDEVILEVRAAGLNHLDIWVRKGRPGVELHMPHVLGSDAAGIVRSVGANVRNVRGGDSVMVNPALSCGMCEYCLRGQQSECLWFGIIGLARPGTFAEYVAVPATNVHSMPSHLTFEEAASLPLSYLTAWRMLMSRAGLRPGETVLIHGIGGGVALAALQLARLAGAETIVTSSSDEKLARAKALGADHTINYRDTEDVAGAVKAVTGGRGVDIAFDTAGAATLPTDVAAVRRGGRIVLCGVTTGAAADLNLSAVYWNHLTIMGSTMGSHEDFRQMLRAVSATGLRPVIDSVEPLSQARELMGRMERGEQFGKLVLAPHGVETPRTRELSLEESREQLV